MIYDPSTRRFCALIKRQFLKRLPIKYPEEQQHCPPPPPPPPPPSSPSSLVSRPAQAHIQCLWRSCLSFYVICLLFLTTSISLILVLWPHYPTYSMCSDELRWSSIIEGMTHLQTKASYQLLISIYNPNVFDAVVDYGSGIMR